MKTKAELYNDDFYRERNKKTRYAAKKVLKIVADIMEINSAIDVGCGVGTWLKEVRNINSDVTVKGLDGSYVNTKYLQIKKNEFLPSELEKQISVSEKYDLAISLEVAEHLTSARAASFVKDLCKLSNVVLFAAATKQQGGDGHINEQRCSYWVKLFKKNGYVPFDVIRPNIWNDKQIPIWYRQNTILYINREVIELYQIKPDDENHIYDIIHPENYESVVIERTKYKASFGYKIQKLIDSIKTGKM